MKEVSTAKTCDPSTVKRVSGQMEQMVIFSLVVWGQEERKEGGDLSRGAIRLQRQHLISLLAAQRTGVINSTSLPLFLPPSFLLEHASGLASL